VGRREGMKKSILNVEGMSCNHCVMAIKKTVGAIQGVESVDVNLDGGTVSVQHGDGVNMEQLKEAIQGAGYDVK
jgi:copper chaperone